MARYWISSLVSERFPTRFPYGTLIINVTGSLIIGVFLTLVTERVNIHPNWRLAFAVGFVGAYTTFSTFEYETFKLLETGNGISGLANVVVSLALGFVAVWGGVALGRWIEAPAIIRQTVSRDRADRVAAPAPEATSASPAALDESLSDSGKAEH
jgi:CrcB protein